MARRESSLIPVDEDRAARLVERALADAVREMEATVQRMLARGGLDAKDRRWLSEMTSALDDLAAQYGDRIVRGPYGKQVTDALNAGAKEAARSMGTDFFALDRRQIDLALFTRQVKIKNLLEDGARWASEQVGAALVRGTSLRDLSRTIEDGLRLADGAAVPAWRAEMIARNEVIGAYREGARLEAKEEGITLYQMTGPLDRRTSAICRKHVGQVKTVEQWEKIAPLVFRYGLHPNCRHSWDPVSDLQSESVKALADAARQQRQRLKAAA